MSKSFEDKIRESLSDYRAEPPEDAKRAIIGAPVAGWNWTGAYHVVGGLLLLLAMFMTGYLPQLQLQNQAQTHVSNKKGTYSKEDVKHTMIIPGDPTIDQENVEENKNTIDAMAENIPPKHSKNDPIQNENPEMYFTEEDVKTVDDKEENFVYVTRDIQELSYHQAYVKGDRTLMFSGDIVEKIIPEPDPVFTPYMDAGAFFLYNRLEPNLDDEIYVANYDAPFSLSAARIGFTLSLGLAHDWNERFNSRLGLVFNNYNQQFSFSVRNTTPDSVSIKADLIQPIFEEEHVQIKKRVSTIGLRLQNTFAFPSKFNSVYFSAEYQRRIGAGPLFNYEGRSYSLSSPNQWLLEFGLRKQLARLRNGNIFIIPGIRYSVTKLSSESILSVKPFSVGVSMSYTLK